MFSLLLLGRDRFPWDETGSPGMRSGVDDGVRADDVAHVGTTLIILRRDRFPLGRDQVLMALFVLMMVAQPCALQP